VVVRFVLVALLVFGANGCAPGMSVRDRILASKSPLISNVYSDEGGEYRAPLVEVFLVSGTTEADAETFWCNVVVPAGGTHDTSRIRVTLAIVGGSFSAASSSTCGSK
jgi:hypothetical protein